MTARVVPSLSERAEKCWDALNKDAPQVSGYELGILSDAMEQGLIRGTVLQARRIDTIGRRLFGEAKWDEYIRGVPYQPKQRVYVLAWNYDDATQGFADSVFADKAVYEMKYLSDPWMLRSLRDVTLYATPRFPDRRDYVEYTNFIRARALKVLPL
jgi:hypothetical protein